MRCILNSSRELRICKNKNLKKSIKLKNDILLCNYCRHKDMLTAIPITLTAISIADCYTYCSDCYTYCSDSYTYCSDHYTYCPDHYTYCCYCWWPGRSQGEGRGASCPVWCRRGDCWGRSKLTPTRLAWSRPPS